ncbi:transposase [Micromonospora sp. ZYX-F-536]|uniref:transposase n=1 Tax=Micromonospora sp. ZYX-F-536 TaxID=3457629 RepID=UPI0040408FAC
MTDGRPRTDDPRVLNGIVWKIRAGAAWRDVPARYGYCRYSGTRRPSYRPGGAGAGPLCGLVLCQVKNRVRCPMTASGCSSGM